MIEQTEPIEVTAENVPVASPEKPSVQIPARIKFDGNVEVPPQAAGESSSVRHIISIVPQGNLAQTFNIEVEKGLFSAGDEILLTLTKT